VVIQMPSAAPAPSPTDLGDVPPPDPTPASSAATSGKPATAMHGPKPTASSNPGTAAPTNSAIAALLGGNNGPSPGGPSLGGGGGGGGGSSLTGDQVERTVKNYQAGVRRSCYDRLATDKTGTVQVTVTATVAGSGGVQNASADGNDPMIAKCIESAVRNWQFPATGGTTTVRIPFKFVRQN
jgi:hypothetical protein